jgi:hypothetical protein
MEPELQRLLHYRSREQLIMLLHQLVARHPALLAEVLYLLEDEQNQQDEVGEIDEEATENWDFSGDETAETVEPLEVSSYPSRVVPVYTAFMPLDVAAVRQRLASYTARLAQGETVQMLRRDLGELFKEAELRAGRHDYQGTLDLYALLLDTYLATEPGELRYIFDAALDAALPALEAFLAEVSSTLQTDATFSPLLSSEQRQRWVTRLFALWLQRVTAHHAIEPLSDMLYTLAWHEDTAMLRALIQQELQRQSGGESANIVNFTQQYQTRALERLLKGLPRDT